MPEIKVRPFSCGTQYMDWCESNCCACRKSLAYPNICSIVQAIASACFGDGSIDEDMAKRMGWRPGPPFHYVWECTERESK